MFRVYFVHIKQIFLLLLIVLSIPLFSKELLMLTDDGPPHMIAASNNGIDVDIAREILQEMGHKVKVNFAPLKRSMVQVVHKDADLFLPTFFQRDTSELFISKAIISYRPTVFSLKNNNFKFNRISDLAEKKLVTFQGATGYLGDEFLKVAQSKGYRELHDMSKFPEMLIKQRCEVVVLDYYIFYYFLREYLKNNLVEKSTVNEIEQFELFPEVKAHVGFNDEILRNEFNDQLQLYKKHGKQNVVIDKYIGLINY